ncbi:MAG: divergent polysaccharide deacetylase family protein [Pseudomonadota bacterium]
MTGSITTGPDTTGPNAGGPNASAPNTCSPNTSGPDTSEPNVNGPNMNGPNMNGPMVLRALERFRHHCTAPFMRAVGALIRRAAMRAAARTGGALARAGRAIGAFLLINPLFYFLWWLLRVLFRGARMLWRQLRWIAAALWRGLKAARRSIIAAASHFADTSRRLCRAAAHGALAVIAWPAKLVIAAAQAGVAQTRRLRPRAAIAAVGGAARAQARRVAAIPHIVTSARQRLGASLRNLSAATRRLAATAFSALAKIPPALAQLRIAFASLRPALARLRPSDAAIASLVVIAASGPALAPRLSDDATIALTRANPFADRNGVRAERGVSVAPPSTPTLWSGAPRAVGERGIAPLWVAEALDDIGPLDPAEALAAAPRTLELAPAPVWSPELERMAALAVSDEYLPLETGSVPVVHRFGANPRPLGRRALTRIDLGAIETGPVIRVGVTDSAAVNRGDFTTGSLAQRAPRAAWPGGDVASDLPESIASALNLAAPQTVPPTAAPLPSMRPFDTGFKRTARVTVVLTAVGLNLPASRDALERLPSSVVFAVAPVAQDPAQWVEAAQSRGRVALIEVPMEPKAFPRVNPGPLTLLADAAADENVKRLEETLALAPEADGVATYLGGRFSSSETAAAPVIAALKERDLFLLETAPTPLSALRRTAAEIGLPAASSVVSLDRFGQDDDLREGFARLEVAAREKGHAIGVAVAVPRSVDALAEWARSLEARGFRLTALAL